MLRYLPILLGGFCLLVCLPLFMRQKTLHPVSGAVWKTLGTLCAFGIALTAALMKGEVLWLCVAALLLCALADLLLEVNFLSGMALFLGGHILYILFFLQQSELGLMQGMTLVLLLLAAAGLLYRWRKPILERKMMPAFASYSLVLCIMGACGIGCMGLMTPAGSLMAVGALLFVASDMLVCFNTVATAPKLLDWTAMLIYYLAQLLIAAGAFLVAW